MINRTLIRLKVVQLLYSHLLTRFEFHVIKEPERNTTIAREGFRIYCEILFMMLALTGKTNSANNLTDFIKESDPGNLKPLFPADRLLLDLMNNHEIKSDIINKVQWDADFIKLYKDIYVAIKHSSVYEKYRATIRKDFIENIKLWRIIVRTAIKKIFIDFYSGNEDISESAVEKGIDMVISTLESYENFHITFLEARKEFIQSLDKSYQLYISLLYLALRLTRLRTEQLDSLKHKYLPTEEDLNPDTSFIDNRFVQQIAENKSIENYLKNNPFEWDDDLMVKSLLTAILDSEPYKNFMSKKEHSYADDCSLWIKLFNDVIFPSDDLTEAMESKNVYWNDDLYIMGTFVIKSIRQASKNEEFKVLPMFKDEEDKDFGTRLFELSVNNYNEYKAYIDKYLSSSWDPERIAFMDVVIMVAAIAELINFPNIPLPVTMNEYTEIAADYSTAKSSQFVNGLLFSVSEQLKKEGKIFK